MTAVDGVRAKDAEVEKQGEVTEWTYRADGAEDQLSDIMQLRLAPTYEAPKSHTKSGSLKTSPSKSRPRHQRKTPAAPEDVEMENENEVTATTQKVERRVGDTYPPTFCLTTRDYRGVDGELIAPAELYTELTEGTLFSAQITLHTYIWPGSPRNKIYHIYIERLKVLDKGYGDAWSPKIPEMPLTTVFALTGDPENNDNHDHFFCAVPKKEIRVSLSLLLFLQRPCLLKCVIDSGEASTVLP
ncbi:hypothetical protein B0H13DRAFT_1851282 [Mycena leptocephala]|nr:hypothetical protein B0H13DRAFT_1851282 [Mycena leptocephala]